MDDRAPTLVGAEAAATPVGNPQQVHRPTARRWGQLLFAEVLSASVTMATLVTGQPPNLVADRSWAGVFVLAGLGSASLTALYIVCLHVLGKRSRATTLRRAALTLSPVLLGGLVTAVAALDPDVAGALRVMPRLRLLIGVALGSIAAGTIWATLLWAADEGRGWLRALRLWKAPAAYTGLAGFLVFVASGGGHLYSADEWAAYAVAHSLATRASILVRDNDPYPLHHIGILAGQSRTDGGRGGAALARYRDVTPPAEQPAAGYSKWPLLPSLAAAPIYALARTVGSEPDRASELFANEKRGRPLVPLLVGPAWGAATLAGVVWLLRGAGYGLGTALIVAGLLAFATPWWPYSKTLLNVVPAGFLLVVGLGAAARSQPGRWRWPVVAGVAAGLASATRYELLLLVVPLGALIAAKSWSKTRNAPLRGEIVPLVAYAGAWAAVVAVGVLLPNMVTSGHPLDFGYGSQQTLAGWSDKPHIGIYGILLSPGFGLFVHAPVLALAALALVWLWEDAPPLATVIAAIAAGFILFYGSFGDWRAGATWGPRYLVTMTPLLCLPLAAFIRRNARSYVAMGALAGLGLWGAAVNGLAVLFAFTRGWQNLWALDASLWSSTWTPQFSLIGAQLRLLRLWYEQQQGSFDLYLAAHAGWLVVALLAAAAVVLVVGLARAGDAPACTTADG